MYMCLYVYTSIWYIYNGISTHMHYIVCICIFWYKSYRNYYTYGWIFVPEIRKICICCVEDMYTYIYNYIYVYIEIYTVYIYIFSDVYTYISFMYIYCYLRSLHSLNDICTRLQYTCVQSNRLACYSCSTVN